MYAVLYQVIADLRRPESVEIVFADLFTYTERVALAKRLAIAMFLEKGRSYEHIRRALKVSSATIAMVAERVGKPGMQHLLMTIKADEWATSWSAKIVSLFRSISGKPAR